MNIDTLIRQQKRDMEIDRKRAKRVRMAMKPVSARTAVIRFYEYAGDTAYENVFGDAFGK